MYTLPPIPADGKAYLWLPVQLSSQKKRLRILSGPENAVVLELFIPAGEGRPDYFVPVELSFGRGRKLQLEIDAPDCWFDSLRMEDRPPQREACRRPLLHFTPDRGWMNDPNGLIFHDGVYHLYFQYYPCGLAWGDMHWGHAVSRDLLRWEQVDTALYPDETGTIFSGSAIRDERGLLGYGGDALAFYYTAAGGNGDWSKGVPFTQRIAVLPAGQPFDGRLQKTGIEALPHIAGENRDPKVFWHPESGAYILALFLDGNEFALFRSTDLRHWEQTQRLTLYGAAECPDLIRLPIEGGRGEKWAFWAADGCYFLGSFDGYRFTQESGRLLAYQTKIPYAAQTYSGLPGRVVSVAWLRTQNSGKPYTSQMAVPVELSLVETAEGLRLRLPPVRELEAAAAPLAERRGLPAGKTLLGSTPDRAFEVRLTLPEACGRAAIQAAGLSVTVDTDARVMRYGDDELALPVLPAGGPMDVSLLVDEDVVELRAMNSVVYGVWQHNAPTLAGDVTLELSGACEAAAALLLQYEL